MSRFKRFAHSLISGYFLLGVNILFTLGTVPLAFQYISTKEFGLWGLTIQMAGYISLLDFGLSGAVARIIIDYKDRPNRAEYGAIIQTDVLVGLAQGGLILIVGTILAFFVSPVLHNVPLELQPKLFWLVIGQACILATTFVTRSISHVLTAHHRFDVTNYANAVGFLVNFCVMWWRFARGDGVFGMLWGQAAGTLLAMAVNGIACSRLKLLPQRGQWGRPSWEKFHELFAFGRDVFLYGLGGQFIYASQTVLLTRMIGLDAVTVWVVYTRAFMMLVQVIGRIFDFSSSALAEMMVRRDREKLLRRFREIAVLSVNLAVAAGAVLAVTNTPFVHIWKAGKVFQNPWSPWNDLLLAIWLLTSTAIRSHTGLVGQSKAIHFMRYIFFIEGLTFITLTVLLHRFGGITMMLGLSIFCNLCFTLPYGLWRTHKYFNLSWDELARWHRSTLLLITTLAPVGLLVWWFTRNLPSVQRLVLAPTILGIWAGWMFLRYGLGGSLRTEVSRRAPAWARPILARAGLAKSEN